MDNYYLSLKEFDYIYYKNYNKQVYKYEEEILKLFNSEITKEEFNIENKAIQYQILSDYERVFNLNKKNSNNYNNKAIEYNNNQTKIKRIINTFNKYDKEYYNNFLNILDSDNFIFYYLSNIFDCIEDINFISNINKDVLCYINKYINKNINKENNNILNEKNVLDDEKKINIFNIFNLFNKNNKSNIESVLESNILKSNNYQLNKICKEILFYLYCFYKHTNNIILLNKIKNILKYKNDNFYILDEIEILKEENKSLNIIKPFLKSTIINYNNSNNINNKYLVYEYFINLLNDALTNTNNKRYQKIILHKYFIMSLNKCNDINKFDLDTYKNITKCNIIDIFDTYFHLIELNYIYFDYINIHSIYLLSNKKYIELQSKLSNNENILDEYKNNIIHNYNFSKFYMNKYNITIAIENYDFSKNNIQCHNDFNINNDLNIILDDRLNTILDDKLNNDLKEYLLDNSNKYKFDIKYIDNDILKIYSYNDFKNYIKKKRLKDIFNYTLNNSYIIKNICETLNNDDSNNNYECLICYNDIKYQVITNCNHNFCSDCFIKILNTNTKKCPYCRQDL